MTRAWTSGRQGDKAGGGRVPDADEREQIGQPAAVPSSPRGERRVVRRADRLVEVNVAPERETR